MKCCSSGIYGARLGVYPMQENFVDVILGAVKKSDRRNLAVITDDLGTTVQGERRRVFDYITQLISLAFEPEGHTVVNLLLSYGCEGDVPEKIPQDTEEKIVLNTEGRENVSVSCAWSYYPLGAGKHLDTIEKTISTVQNRDDLTITRAHYCTRIDGSLGILMTTLEDAFETSVKNGIHTVFHLTISKGSPSKARKKIIIEE